MGEAGTITNEELAILCDIVSGWSMKWADNLRGGQGVALDRLIADGFVEPKVELSRLRNISTPPRPRSCLRSSASE